MQTFQTKVIEKKNLTDDTIQLTVTCPEDFNFIPGQYVFFKIVKDKETKQRAYSILNKENNKLNFAIRLLEKGFASEVFKKTKEGDEFELKGPLGHMTFDENEQEHWFIGCGCGIAPLICMINENIAKFPDKKFVLLFSTKTKEDLLFFEELHELEKKHTNFTYIPTLTRDKWKGKTGRVQNHLPDDLTNKIFYICGIKELVEDVKNLLLEKGVDKSKVKVERYS